VNRSAATVAAGLIVLGGLAGAVPARAESPLDDARNALQHHDYSGRMTIEWTDTGGHHQAHVGVRVSKGLVSIDGPTKEVAAGGERLMLGDNGWTLMWPAASLNATPPALQHKYAIATAAGPVVAGRPTRLIEVDVGGRPRDRLAVDTETGVLLRREQFDTTGRLVRVMSFDSIRLDATGSASPQPQRRDLPREMRARQLPAPFLAPRALGAGYRRVGLFRQAGAVHVLYSDGLYSLSLFQQGAGLDQRRLPSGGRVAMVGRSVGRAYAWPGGEVVTWARSGTTYTVVGDGPAADVEAAAASLPAPRRLSIAQRVRRGCRAMVEAVSGLW
jgi:negative regulator of sigma E activity